MAWAVLLVWLSVPFGVCIGIWIGRSWSSLPRLRPGTMVEFQANPPGMTRSLMISNMEFHSSNKLTVTLTADMSQPTKKVNRR